MAALGLLVIVAHLLIAQLVLLFGVTLQLISLVTRWRPLWLVAPAAAGLAWMLAIGPAAAWHGLTEGPHQVLEYIAGAGTDPARVFHLGRGYAGIGHWLPRQAPLALIIAAAEAAVAGWLRRSQAGAEAWPAARPGLAAVARRRFTAGFVRSGGVVSRDGACLGVDWQTGRPACVPWTAAAGGVLVAGARPGAVSATSFQLVHAGIRRRKPVVVVDFAGTEGLAQSLAAVCADAGAPLLVFAADGPGCYDPLGGRDPVRNTALVMGMIDWGSATDYARRTAAGYLNDLFQVKAAAPGDPGEAALDDVIQLLRPPELRARMRRVPPYHPGREVLAERVRASASQLDADPATAAFLAGALAELRGSPQGRWLRTPARPRGAEARIKLGAAVRDRAVVLFSLQAPRPGRPAQMIANLVALDLQAVFAESARLGIDRDGLVWLGNCEVISGPTLTDLITTGLHAGLATVLSTASPGAAEGLAALANVLVVRGAEAQGLADLPAARTARPDHLALVIKGPPRQAVPEARFVPAGIR